MIALAKREGRKLTEEEQSHFEEIREERAGIAMEVEAQREIRYEETDKQDISRRFAQMCDKTLRSGGATQIEVRANELTEASINDSQVPVLLQSIIKPLQENFILNQLGMQVMNGVHGDPVWSVQGVIEASAEGENTEVEESKLDFSALRGKPKRIAISVPVSNRAVNQSNYDLYSIVMSAMGEACARKLNQIVLSTGMIGEYTGLFQGLDDKNKMRAPLDWGGVIDLEGAVLNTNLDISKDRSAYVLNTKSYSQLKKTVYEKGDSRMVLDVQASTLNGYKLLVSNYVRGDFALFGDFSQSGAVYYGGASLIIDPFTQARKNIVVFTLNMDADVVRFRKEAFAVLLIMPTPPAP